MYFIVHAAFVRIKLMITTCRPVRAVNVQRQYSYWRFKYSNVQFVTVTTTHLCIFRGRLNGRILQSMFLRELGKDPDVFVSVMYNG